MLQGRDGMLERRDENGPEHAHATLLRSNPAGFGRTHLAKRKGAPLPQTQYIKKRLPDTHKKRLVFGKRMDAVGENLFAVDKSDHAGGRSSRPPWEKPTPPWKKVTPPWELSSTESFFSRPAPRFNGPPPRKK